VVALLDVDERDLVRAIDDLVGEGVVATLVPYGLAAAGGKRLVQAQHIPGAGGRGEGGHIHRQWDGGRGGRVVGRGARQVLHGIHSAQAAIRRAQRVQPDRPGSLGPEGGHRLAKDVDRREPFEQRAIRGADHRRKGVLGRVSLRDPGTEPARQRRRQRIQPHLLGDPVLLVVKRQDPQRGGARRRVDRQLQRVVGQVEFVGDITGAVGRIQQVRIRALWIGHDQQHLGGLAGRAFQQGNRWQRDA